MERTCDNCKYARLDAFEAPCRCCFREGENTHERWEMQEMTILDLVEEIRDACDRYLEANR